ncbi:MFS transporter [Stackebrandtia nassauensis]|uniref:Major facilitator superfamily MFS_1 n=1 Tax=Stackebrandtia nassauensis (strain DSM 44728 / CIP 108903 / NRRL B-16338 / NBRC 102104 / LLR-40K-21) TaxID=446470 RepID=D3Q7I0_STANL|nr:MFS transporter [Stackebrandtia nassauensis]ADD44322.1 major facilitator superfamily MFS_1 [Stackebrandtia nassauensis DSM 44728]
MSRPSSRLRDLPATYWRLCVSHGISSFGDFLRMTTIAFWAYEASDGSAAAVGAFATTELLVAMVSGSVAGVIADRWNRVTVMIASDFGRVATGVVLVAAVVWNHIPAAVVAVAASGFLTALFTTCRGALLPGVVPRELLARGNSLMITVEQVAVVASPGIAAVLFGTLGAAPALVIDALSFLVSGVLILGLRYREPAPSGEDEDGEAESSRNGAAVNWLVPVGFAVAALAAMMYQFGANSSTLVAFLPEDLDRPVTDAFWFAMVSGAIQLFAGTLLSALAHRLRLRATMVLSAACVMVGGWTLAYAPNLFTAVAGVGIIACANIPFRVAFETLPQLLVPSRVLGRVIGVVKSVSASAFIAGTLGGGLIADQAAPRTSLVVSALILSLGALLSLGLLTRTVTRAPKTPVG